MNRILDGILMSAMKSGSTWLSSLCEKHPEVFVCRGQVVKTSEMGRIESIDWTGYDGQPVKLVRRNLKPEHYYLESYYHHNRNMKFVCLLRNPVRRSFSQYGHERRQEVANSIKAIIVPQVFDYNLAVNDALKSSPMPLFIDKSLYFKYLSPYFERFGMESFLIAPLEKASADPDGFLKELCAFLDIEYVPIEDAEKRVNVKSHSAQGRLKRKYKLIPSSKETEEKLWELFLPDARKLEEATGINFLNYWRRQPVPE